MRAKLYTAEKKLKKTLRAARSAWWVFLIIAAYTVFARYFLGSGCLIASSTGLPCPGCGETRALIALLHGDLAGSIRFHPLLIPSMAVLAVYFVSWLTREKTPRYARAMLLGLTLALIVTYAARMVLMFPSHVPMVINHRGVLPRIVELITGKPL
ncbi:MAG: DUF2752 domain-containing protein [Oscillospiraceae bacterium]|jgi:hypothetical protein|nr:DUF2752 domain-containing protein [Oscillospiraceae bacterium]